MAGMFLDHNLTPALVPEYAVWVLGGLHSVKKTALCDTLLLYQLLIPFFDFLSSLPGSGLKISNIPLSQIRVL